MISNVRKCYMPTDDSTDSFDNFLDSGKKSMLNGEQFCGFGLSDIAIYFSEKQDSELYQYMKFKPTASFDGEYYLVKFKNFQKNLSQVFSDFFIENEDEFWFHFELNIQNELDKFDINHLD